MDGDLVKELTSTKGWLKKKKLDELIESCKDRENGPQVSKLGPKSAKLSPLMRSNHDCCARPTACPAARLADLSAVWLPGVGAAS